MLFIMMVILAYFIGSISTAIVACRCARLPDPRTAGSNNPGATNVLRLGGKKLAIIVLLGDFAKGVIPILLAKSLHFPIAWQAWLGLAAVIGHMYPIFFHFIGGKGVATAFGALAALYWPMAVLLAIVWLIVALVFRYSSLAALLCAALAPGLADYFIPSAVLPILIISLLLFWRHRSNIKRLLNRTESKLFAKKDSTQ